MARTPEQKKADDDLTAAIEAVIKAYDFIEPGMLNTDYMVLLQQRGWDEQGDAYSGIVTLYKDGTMPWATIFGLVNMAKMKVEVDFKQDMSTDRSED